MVESWKILIDLSPDVFTRLFDADGYISEKDAQAMGYAIRDGIVLPENPTNGDVIKIMFPDAKSKRNLAPDILYFGRSRTMIRYTNKWWNAPYKPESEG